MKHLLLTVMILVPSMASAQSSILIQQPATEEAISAKAAEQCGEIHPTLRDYRRFVDSSSEESFRAQVFTSPRDGEACEKTRRDLRVYYCRYNVAWQSRPRAVFLGTDASGTPLSVRRAQDIAREPIRRIEESGLLVVTPERRARAEAEEQREVAEAMRRYQNDLAWENVALSVMATVESDYRQAFSLLTENECTHSNRAEGNDPIIDNPKPLTHGRPNF